mgnify:CR=1 FL=1
MKPSSNLLMIRPVAFESNIQTMESNAFQERNPDVSAVQQQALQEFEQMVDMLRSNDLQVSVIDSQREPHTPDAIFPNNWLSTHEDGTLVLYPMEAPNRRQERRPAIIEALKDKFNVTNIIDLSNYEAQHMFLEGTGSLVLDRTNKIAYACLSSRTHQEVLSDFSTKLGYQILAFEAADAENKAIYHTNVMMCVAESFAVVCLEAIGDKAQRKQLETQLQKSKKVILGISREQMGLFAGNMLEVMNTKGERFLVMSDSAYHSLSDLQINTIKSFCQILHTPLETIETNGGGSARCMMAEIYLAPKQ